MKKRKRKFVSGKLFKLKFLIIVKVGYLFLYIFGVSQHVKLECLCFIMTPNRVVFNSLSIFYQFLCPHSISSSFTRISYLFNSVNVPIFRADSRCYKEDLSIALWKPAIKLSDDQLKAYVDLAEKRCLLGEEKALSLLYFRDHNLETAKQDCVAFASRPSDWFEEEELLFSKILRLKSKRLPRIQRWVSSLTN